MVSVLSKAKWCIFLRVPPPSALGITGALFPTPLFIHPTHPPSPDVGFSVEDRFIIGFGIVSSQHPPCVCISIRYWWWQDHQHSHQRVLLLVLCVCFSLHYQVLYITESKSVLHINAI